MEQAYVPGAPTVGQGDRCACKGRGHRRPSTSSSGDRGRSAIAGGGGTAALDTTPCDIEPYAGRVLLFDSLLQHEVMPSFRDRYAITLWTWREDGDQDKVGFS